MLSELIIVCELNQNLSVLIKMKQITTVLSDFMWFSYGIKLKQ